VADSASRTTRTAGLRSPPRRLTAAVLQGIFHTAQKPLLARYTGFEVTAYAMWAGTVFILPWTGSLLRALPHAGAAAVGSAGFLGLAPSAAGFVLWAYAMARMDVGRVTVSLYLVPRPRSGSRWSGWARSRGRPS
jgi:drug/metabolite transporter (DMT)-like permease